MYLEMSKRLIIWNEGSTSYGSQPQVTLSKPSLTLSSIQPLLTLLLNSFEGQKSPEQYVQLA